MGFHCVWALPWLGNLLGAHSLALCDIVLIVYMWPAALMLATKWLMCSARTEHCPEGPQEMSISWRTLLLQTWALFFPVVASPISSGSPCWEGLKDDWRVGVKASQGISPPSSLPQSAPQAAISNLGGTSSHKTSPPTSARIMTPRLSQFCLLLPFCPSGVVVDFLLLVMLGGLTASHWLFLIPITCVTNSFHETSSVSLCVVSLFPAGLSLIHWLTVLFKTFLPLPGLQFPCL